VATGFTSQIAHAGGPPFQMWVMPQKPPHTVFAGTTAIFFAAVNLIKVPAYVALGQFTPANLIAALALLPFVGDDYLLKVATEILVFALLAFSLQLLIGVGGLVSFGHAAYFGLGAYGAALALRHLGVPMEIALPLAPLAAALGAALAALLTRTALRPLTRLSSGARDIAATGDAARRLPTPPATDEVGELAATLNRMLASLERAREAERRFVGDASHELRTPLTALRGNVAYALRHGPDDAVLADIDDGVRGLGRLLDDLLALAREDAASPSAAEVVDLVALAREAAADDPLQRTTVAGDRGSVLVRGERDALARAIGNLVQNARRHGPAGGRIRMTVGIEDGRARLTVADEGAGLAPDDAARAFERFWRAPGAREPGSGLGLPIVRAIAERHEGEVRVDGPRFTLDLPSAAAHGSLKDRT
jgi:signal transduction histidine kinase